MLDDKLFLEREVTPYVAKLVDEIKKMIAQKATIPTIYNHILKNSRDYRERNITLFLFGMAYQGYKEDNHLK